MKLILIGLVLGGGLGFWFGRYPISEWRPVSFWHRRREAFRRRYYEDTKRDLQKLK